MTAPRHELSLLNRLPEPRPVDETKLLLACAAAWAIVMLFGLLLVL